MLAERTVSWNPQKYYIDNLFLSLGIALVSALLVAKFFGPENFIVFFMVTSHVHFGVSYLFHYNVLKRTLTTREKQLFFFLTFFPLVITFSVIYYGWLPVSFRGYPFMVYFMIHMIRDEYVFYVQRGSDFKYTELDTSRRTHMIFSVLACMAVLHAHYLHGLANPSELSASYRGLPSWTLYSMLIFILIWGIRSFYQAHRTDKEAFLRNSLYVLGVVSLIFLYYTFLVPRMTVSISRLHTTIIFYHYITWYIFGIERVLYYQSQRIESKPGARTSLSYNTPPVPYRGDPFWKFKHSLPHFLGLLLGFNLLLLALYGVSLLEPFQFLDVLFKGEYIALWSFPHITLHFYPRR